MKVKPRYAGLGIALGAALGAVFGVIAGNGQALGLDEKWAYYVIKTIGNYGEVFDRNVGARSAIRLERGVNRLSTDGGLMFAPSLRP